VARVAAVASGALLILVAFIAAFNVADSRQGLIAEVVTLLSGLAGVGLLLYGLVPKRRVAGQPNVRAQSTVKRVAIRSANDLLIGAGGLLLAAVLLTGLNVSGGWLWTLLGAALLSPMVIGCVYLIAAFIRAPQREWRIDLRRLTGQR
jgi:hypothetical protein